MLNRIILMGRLTHDSELRRTQSDTPVCSFSLAVDRNFVRQGEERKADFINCVAWRTTAEFISRYFHKGNLVAVEGSIQTRSWDDQDGKKRYATEVIVNQAYFVESKKDAQQSAGTGESFGGGDYGSLPDPISPMGTDDDLPF